MKVGKKKTVSTAGVIRDKVSANARCIREKRLQTK
jgi:hypothetical protein